MPHACLTAYCVAVQTHTLSIDQQLGLFHVVDAVIGFFFFRQFLLLKSQKVVKIVHNEIKRG